MRVRGKHPSNLTKPSNHPRKHRLKTLTIVHPPNPSLAVDLAPAQDGESQKNQRRKRTGKVVNERGKEVWVEVATEGSPTASREGTRSKKGGRDQGHVAGHGIETITDDTPTTAVAHTSANTAATRVTTLPTTTTGVRSPVAGVGTEPFPSANQRWYFPSILANV